MPVPVPSTAGGDGPPPGAGPLAARVAAGPGLWQDGEWLSELRRAPLLESLLADGAIAAAAAARHGHRLDRALNPRVTALCLAAGALFPALGYDGVLVLVFGLPGVPARPGVATPAGAACCRARVRHGEAPARAVFEADAARADIPAGPDGTAFGLELTQIDGTTLEMAANPQLAAAFGVPRKGTRPLLRLTGPAGNTGMSPRCPARLRSQRPARQRKCDGARRSSLPTHRTPGCRRAAFHRHRRQPEPRPLPFSLLAPADRLRRARAP